VRFADNMPYLFHYGFGYATFESTLVAIWISWEQQKNEHYMLHTLTNLNITMSWFRSSCAKFLKAQGILRILNVCTHTFMSYRDDACFSQWFSVLLSK
jgi:hypothetical protein